MKSIEEYAALSEVLKAIAHPARLCIVRGLMDNACNVTKIQQCLALPQSTISQHLAKLKASGIVKGERNGLEICYQVVNPQVIAIVKALYGER